MSLVALTATKHRYDPSAPDSVLDFARGFRLHPTPIVDISTGSRALQMQELIAFDDPADAAALIGFYSAWGEADGTPSALWRARSTKADPTTWTDHTELLTHTASGLSYVRLHSATFDGTTWRFYLGAGSNSALWTSTNAGTTLTSLGTVLTQAGQGVEDAGPVSLLSVRKIGETHWGIYTVDSATPQAAYRLCSSSDGVTFTKTDQTILTPGESGADSGGLEWHFWDVIDDKVVMSYEAWNGSDHWSANIAHAPLAGFTGTWTKMMQVLVHDATVAGATAHIATPSFAKISGTWRMFCQGSSTTSPATGNGGPWRLYVADRN